MKSARLKQVFPFASCAFLLLACSSGETGTGGAGGGGAGGTGGSGGSGGEPSATVEWGPCPEGFRDECATIAMPLNHDDPEGETIDVFISRRGTGSKQLWLLQGGPGASAEVFYNLHDFLDVVDPDLQVLTMEHRGVGDSTRIGCSAEAASSPGGVQVVEEEWVECQDDVKAKWGDKLPYFSATQAAHDLAFAIDLTRKDDQPVFVYGGSYGTIWANRYAVLHPDQPSGIILDAPAQPGATTEYYDTWFEPVGRRVFSELCPMASRCSEHLGADPLAFLEQTVTKLEMGHCSSLGLDAATWKLVFAVFLMDYNLRNWLPAVTYRLDRCSNADMNAIATLFENIFNGGNKLPRKSSALQVHIVLSEMWPEGHVDEATVNAAQATANFWQDALAPEYQLQDTWPKYAPDEFYPKYAPANVPVLTLAGQDDPATPPAITGYGFRDNLTGPNQTFVEIPFGTHTVLRGGPVANGDPCPMRLVRAFLADPSQALPVSCVGEVLPPSFNAPTEVSMKFFGTEDLYD